MKIQLLCFAALKEFFPHNQEIHLENKTTVNDLKKILNELNPLAKDLIHLSRISINQTIASETDIITEGSVVALLPPSSGG